MRELYHLSTGQFLWVAFLNNDRTIPPKSISIQNRLTASGDYFRPAKSSGPPEQNDLQSVPPAALRAPLLHGSSSPSTTNIVCSVHFLGENRPPVTRPRRVREGRSACILSTVCCRTPLAFCQTLPSAHIARRAGLPAIDRVIWRSWEFARRTRFGAETPCSIRRRPQQLQACLR